MKLFQANTAYAIQLDLKIGNIPQETLYELLRSDGRRLGNLAEPILVSEFKNLQQSKNGNSKFDLLELPKEGGARVWEVKTVSAGNTCSLVASKYKGVGRTFDAKEHAARMKNLTGYIVFDLEHVPTIRIKGFEIAYLHSIGCDTAITRKVLNKEMV